jgi:hypothetical protein
MNTTATSKERTGWWWLRRGRGETVKNIIESTKMKNSAF